MPRIGKNIYKRKDGRWEGRYIQDYNGGKAHYASVYAKSYQDVKKKLDLARYNTLTSCSSQDEEAKTLRNISDEWIQDASHILKESSVIKYENMLRCYILPVFGEQKLSQITNEQLDSFAKRLLAEGGVNRQGLSKSTVLEVMATINHLRLYALRHNQYVPFSPECISIKRDESKIRVFSVEEQDCLVKWLENNMNLTSLSILLCLFTGIRVGEVCALKWGDIDLEAGTLRITKTMQRLRNREDSVQKTEVKLLPPKSGHSLRVIPIPQNIRSLLLQYSKSGNSYLLTGLPDRFVEPRTLQNRFKKILEKCGITNANFHTTRHTFATRCVEQGFDIKCLSEILGHAGVSITLNKYVHPSMKLKSENMKLIAALYPLGNEKGDSNQTGK